MAQKLVNSKPKVWDKKNCKNVSRINVPLTIFYLHACNAVRIQTKLVYNVYSCYQWQLARLSTMYGRSQPLLVFTLLSPVLADYGTSHTPCTDWIDVCADKCCSMHPLHCCLWWWKKLVPAHSLHWSCCTRGAVCCECLVPWLSHQHLFSVIGSTRSFGYTSQDTSLRFGHVNICWSWQLADELLKLGSFAWLLCFAQS